MKKKNRISGVTDLSYSFSENPIKNFPNLNHILWFQQQNIFSQSMFALSNEFVLSIIEPLIPKKPPIDCFLGIRSMTHCILMYLQALGGNVCLDDSHTFNRHTTFFGIYIRTLFNLSSNSYLNCEARAAFRPHIHLNSIELVAFDASCVHIECCAFYFISNFHFKI